MILEQEQTSVLIVDDIASTREDIKRLLYFENDIKVVGEAADGEEALEAAKKLRPDVILMDINLPRMDGITASEIISTEIPESVIVIISIQGEQEYLRKAMSAGARDYLVKPFSSTELSETIRRTASLSKKRLLNYQNSHYDVTSTSQAPDTHSPKVISIFSSKGGTGKTTIACNLAITLSQSTEQRVVLVDLDLMNGDVSMVLNLSSPDTIYDLIQEEHLDEPLIDSYLSPHISGVNVLSAPSAPEQAEAIKPDHIKDILYILKKKYQYIIIDNSSVLSEATLSALECSDIILLVLNKDLLALKHAKTDLDILETLQYGDKVKLILNRASENWGVKEVDLVQTLKNEFIASIPSDSKTVISSINKGQPFTLTGKFRPIAREFLALADKLSNKKNEKKSNGNLKHLLPW